MDRFNGFFQDLLQSRAQTASGIQAAKAWSGFSAHLPGRVPFVPGALSAIISCQAARSQLQAPGLLASAPCKRHGARSCAARRNIMFGLCACTCAYQISELASLAACPCSAMLLSSLLTIREFFIWLSSPHPQSWSPFLIIPMCSASCHS